MRGHDKEKTMQRAGRQPKRTRFDLVIVALVGILTFIEETGLLDKWQFDEVPFFLFALAIALIWFAYRRVQELKAEIAERQQAEEALSRAHTELEQTKQYLESLIESSTDAIIATDEDGVVVLFNRGAEALSGYRREEILGQRGPVLYESEEDAKAVMLQIREGGGTISAFETTFRTKDGSLVPVLISASMLYDEEGHEAGTVGFSKDLRERKQDEEKLRRAHDELKEAYETLEQAQASAIVAEKLAALGRLIAGVSHEMLNPLQVVTLNLHMLIKAPSTPPEIVSQLREVEEHANRITKILQDLLHFARHRLPERQPVDCNEAVRRTVDLMKHDFKLNDITVEGNFAKALPAVSADQDQLRQVILNLLTNARDAMPDGGRLLLRTNTVMVNGERWVELRVEDTGSGIAPGHMEKLFDPFFTTKAEGEGTGLGLSICKGIVEAHGGAIWAENTSGGGADFIVQLAIWGE